MYFFNLSNDTRPYPLGQFCVAVHGGTLVAHLGHYLVFAGGVEQCARLADVVGEGFFHINVFAELHGCEGRHGVGMVGCGHHYCIDVARRSVEHFAEIAVTRHLWEFRIGLGGTAVVNIAEGHESFRFFQRAEVRAAFAADADEGDVEAVAGRDITLAAQDKTRNNGEGKGGFAGCFEETAAGLVFFHGITAR